MFTYCPVAMRSTRLSLTFIYFEYSTYEVVLAASEINSYLLLHIILFE